MRMKIKERDKPNSILRRGKDVAGKVLYKTLWQDGTETKESISALRQRPQSIESYNDRRFNLKSNGLESTSDDESDQKPVLSRRNAKKRRQKRRKPSSTDISESSGERDYKDSSSGNIGTSDNLSDSDHIRSYRLRRTKGQCTQTDTSDSDSRQSTPRPTARPQRSIRKFAPSDRTIILDFPVAGLSTSATRRELPSSAVLEYDRDFVSFHWQKCSKCHRGGYPNEPSPKKLKKRSRQTDDSDLSLADEQHQGRLLQCITCSCATHEGCLPSTFPKKNIVNCVIHGEELREYQCNYCIKSTSEALGNIPCCGSCQNVLAPNHPLLISHTSTRDFKDTGNMRETGDSAMEIDDKSADSATEPVDKYPNTLFRCKRCLRAYHYVCLPPFSDTNNPRSASQHDTLAERIAACHRTWSCMECAAYSKDVDVIVNWRPIYHEENIATETPSFDPSHPHEFLVKWKESSYNNLTWVGQNWLQAVAQRKLKNYSEQHSGSMLEPTEKLVPLQWRMIDRILTATDQQGNTIDESNMCDIKHVGSIHVKFVGLSYDEVVWESPPSEDSDIYESFVKAFQRYQLACRVVPPKRMKHHVLDVQQAAIGESYVKHEIKKQPGFVTGGTLMPHQMEGLNWLLYQWERKQACVLADDMGLGKTIQVVVFLSLLFNKFNIYPFLIVVPNSTATNWIREFEKWAENMVVVPFYGSSQGRNLALENEIFRSSSPPNIRCHVVITTNEAALAEASRLDKVSFWPVLVVDEAHRLKNNTSLLFQKLQSLRFGHTVLLTGTPLQNNIRELINIMHFADPKKFADIKGLEESFTELTKDTVQELHECLKPYFLRRTKQVVLKSLPPKLEIIVPLSMTRLQKEVYKDIISKNLVGFQNEDDTQTKPKKLRMNNVLMELRKTLNHPYLVRGVEIKQPNPEQTHRALIEAGAKLKMLHQMLPKLKSQGHRVLLFSTMKLTLDVLEDYFDEEGYEYARLDGDSNSTERVHNIDAFNAPGSDIFIFLLSTKAGGVGINLATADTVIIWDFDFNPHSDLQAISRAHRIGQTKPVLVLRFMTRLSVEERIAQMAKKKLILDHLIVEKMDDDELEPTDVESILKFGTNALFEGDDSKDIVYDSAAIDKLLDRSVIVNAETDIDTENDSSKTMSFSFAKIWSTDKDVNSFEELEENDNAEDNDFWSRALKQKDQLRAKLNENETLGRGARKRNRVQYFNAKAARPEKKKTRKGKEKARMDDETDDDDHTIERDDADDDDFVDIESNDASEDERVFEDEHSFMKDSKSLLDKHQKSILSQRLLDKGRASTSKNSVTPFSNKPWHLSTSHQQTIRLPTPKRAKRPTYYADDTMDYLQFMQWRETWDDAEVEHYHEWEKTMRKNQPQVNEEKYWYLYVQYLDGYRRPKMGYQHKSTPSEEDSHFRIDGPERMFSKSLMHNRAEPDLHSLPESDASSPFNVVVSPNRAFRSPLLRPSAPQSFPTHSHSPDPPHPCTFQQQPFMSEVDQSIYSVSEPDYNPLQEMEYQSQRTISDLNCHCTIEEPDLDRAATEAHFAEMWAPRLLPTPYPFPVGPSNLHEPERSTTISVDKRPLWTRNMPEMNAGCRTLAPSHEFPTQQFQPPIHSSSGDSGCLTQQQDYYGESSRTQSLQKQQASAPALVHAPAPAPSPVPATAAGPSPLAGRKHHLSSSKPIKRVEKIICIICDKIHDHRCPDTDNPKAIELAYRRIDQLPIPAHERQKLRRQLHLLQRQKQKR